MRCIDWMHINPPDTAKGFDGSRGMPNAISYDIAFNMRKGTLGHLRKVPSRISLRNPRRLIRDGNLRLH